MYIFLLLFQFSTICSLHAISSKLSYASFHSLKNKIISVLNHLSISCNFIKIKLCLLPFIKKYHFKKQIFPCFFGNISKHCSWYLMMDIYSEIQQYVLVYDVKFFFVHFFSLLFIELKLAFVKPPMYRSMRRVTRHVQDIGIAYCLEWYCWRDLFLLLGLLCK